MRKFGLMYLLITISCFFCLTGCGTGYNRTLFVTRTNVGFDASTTPPTLELDIGRQEGVVAPQFENGKKLPVLASFRFTNSGFFAPNLGSAFATGDAANTLAALYKEETPYPAGWETRVNSVNGVSDNGRPAKFPGDSTVVLDNKPEILPWIPNFLGWFKPKFQKQEVRPVFFGTDTSLGLKIAWSGMTGQFPDSARLGYNRKELALVPISLEEKNVSGTKKYNMKMSSLLATVDSDVSESEIDGNVPDAELEHIQYFATGNAATLLALQKDVRKAMLSRLDPYGEKFASHLDDESKQVAFILLNPIYNTLREELENDQNAQRLADAMDTLIPSDLTIRFKKYNYRSPNLVDTGLYPTPSGRYPFSKGHSYYTKLVKSIKDLGNALTDEKLATYNSNAITAADRAKLKTDLRSLEVLRDKFKKTISQSKNQEILNKAVRYFYF